jgi:hypothetical protein
MGHSWDLSDSAGLIVHGAPRPKLLAYSNHFHVVFLYKNSVLLSLSVLLRLLQITKIARTLRSTVSFPQLTWRVPCPDTPIALLPT